MARPRYQVRSCAVKKIERELEQAESYKRWLELAAEHDRRCMAPKRRVWPLRQFQHQYPFAEAAPRQTSRLLNHIASPSVTIRSAVLASSALPGVLPPVQLQACTVAGDVQPYLSSKRWLDGSFFRDFPAKRLMRMSGHGHERPVMRSAFYG